jgi:dTDP-4-dehydrorhamnose 3,5-epimerase
MKFHPTFIAGAMLLEPELRRDERGFFSRLFCKDELAASGLINEFPQINNSCSAERGTLRGLHYQLPPATEAKLMRCIRGSIFDVIVDLRPESNSFGKWLGVTLTSENRKMLFVPKGCAHGFLSLEDDAEVIYFASERYQPGQERGLRFDDPGLAIDWPVPPAVVSDKDRSWPDFDPSAPEFQRLRGLQSGPGSRAPAKEILLF